ncbi:MAG: DUF1566 domain-containing protein [Methylococcaceae bacterium]|nr:DUF1566 domain-containing protein [Methylococcaceae bacterium]
MPTTLIQATSKPASGLSVSAWMKTSRLRPVALLLTTLLLHPAAKALAQCNNAFPENTPTRDFTLKDDGTAAYTKTGLIWSRCSLGQIWQAGTCVGAAVKENYFGAFEAVKRANAAQYLGYNTWHLPSIEELQSIVEFHCTNPAINATVFPNTLASWYWSASTYFEFPWYGQPVDFGNGNDDIWYKITYEAYPFPVRLVRNPNAFDPQALGLDTDDDGVNDALEIAQGTNPKLKDNDIAQEEHFIAQLYRDLYLREATADEVPKQVQLLKTNPNRVDRVIALALAPEFSQQHLEVAILLALTINNQIPGREWLNEWRDGLHKGNTSATLVDVFMQKSALKDSYLNASNQDYMLALGTHILNRSLSANELQAGTISLQTMTRAEFTQHWLSSPALKQPPVSQLIVIEIANLLANYALDSANLNEFSKQLDSGKLTPVDLIKLVLNSHGYAKRFMQ